MGEEKNLTAANAISNYEKVYEYFRERLLKVDHYKIAEKLLLDIDEENIYIPYFHKKYAWIRTTGQIIPCEEEAPLEMSDRLLMMHQGSVILDKKGEEKENLSVEQLLGLFNEISIECGN